MNTADLHHAYRLRAPLPTDAESVLALLVAREVADIGAPEITLAGLRDEWGAGDFDLSIDARLVETADGRIVGYAAMFREVTMFVVVAPDHEGLGLGSRLRVWAEHRDRARGSGCHRQWIAASNARARTHLLDAGYRPERSYWRLAGTLDAVGAASSPPAGISLRPVDVDEDAATLHALDEVSFEGNADYVPESFDAFSDEHLRAHDSDPQLSSVAEYRGRAIGFLLARHWGERGVGFIDLLGVHPDHRARGVGTALLQSGCARFAAAGLREAQLGVASDNPNALRLYKRLGMTPRFRYDTYERRAVGPGSDI